MKTKKISALGIIAIILLLVTSCSKDEIMTYTGKDQVYFSFASQFYAYDRVDSVIISLGYDSPLKPDSSIRIRAMIQGAKADYDRPINFTLVDSLSTAKLGEDIVPLYDLSYISANSIYGYIWLKIINNTEKLSNSTLIAAIRTMPNEHFYADHVQIRSETTPNPARKQANMFWVYFDGKNEMPNLWAARTTQFTSIFGEYSRVKFEFICEVLELTREYFTYNPETEDPVKVYSVRFPSTSTLGWVMMINRRLNQYEQEHGKRLKDENDNEVKLAYTFS